MKLKEMTIKQASTLTGYCESALQHAAQRGEIKARKIGRRWVLDTDSVLEYGKRAPHKAPRKNPQENQLNLEEPEKQEEPKQIELDLTEEQKESAKEKLLAKILGDIKIDEENDDESIIAIEADLEDWKTIPIASYEALLEQYRRGFKDGFRAGCADKWTREQLAEEMN